MSAFFVFVGGFRCYSTTPVQSPRLSLNPRAHDTHLNVNEQGFSADNATKLRLNFSQTKQMHRQNRLPRPVFRT